MAKSNFKKIYIVENSDGVFISVASSKKKAAKVVRLGKARWRETWRVVPKKLNEIERWVKAGSELYRGVKR